MLYLGEVGVSGQAYSRKYTECKNVLNSLGCFFTDIHIIYFLFLGERSSANSRIKPWYRIHEYWNHKPDNKVCYVLLKTSYAILRILNFDWSTRNGMWARVPLTTNMLGVRVFFAIIVADFKVFLWVFLIKQLFHSRLLDMRQL